MISKVYFSKTITPENVVKIFKALEKDLPGKVAIKVHSGEQGNQNFLKPEFFQPIVKFLNGTIVECNTAYPGERNNSEKHKKTLKKHGWTKFFDVDLMDEIGPDLLIPVKNGKHLKNDVVGKNIKNYNSMLVLSHFKGHPMGGFGGALKQLSIGCASTAGKSLIHSAGKETDQTKVWDNLPKQEDFLESMAEAASAVVDYFKGNMAFISLMCNMSVDCDCCSVAEDPCLTDIGILASLDPVALDQACLDLVANSEDKGKEHFLERVTSRNGIHTVISAEKLGIGNRDHELVDIDTLKSIKKYH